MAMTARARLAEIATGMAALALGAGLMAWFVFSLAEMLQ